MLLKFKNSRGDTIVEVLIALSIAALALGTSYAIAHQALLRAVAARERDQAVGYLESQVNALKLRQQADPTGSTGWQLPKYYCLDEDGAGSIHQNYNVGTLAIGASNYDSACVKNNQYFLNIDSTLQDSSASPPIKFKLDVRWPRLGGGADNDATFYYRF